MQEEQFYAVTFGAGWRTRGPEGPPSGQASAADAPKKRQQLTVKLPRGPPATSSSCGSAETRKFSDSATGRAYSTEKTGRLTWRNQRWRATTQQWANSGGQYTTTTSIAIIMVVIPAIFLSLLFQRSSNRYSSRLLFQRSSNRSSSRLSFQRSSNRSSSSDLTITSMHCCNM